MSCAKVSEIRLGAGRAIRPGWRGFGLGLVLVSLTALASVGSVNAQPVPDVAPQLAEPEADPGRGRIDSAERPPRLLPSAGLEKDYIPWRSQSSRSQGTGRTHESASRPRAATLAASNPGRVRLDLLILYTQSMVNFYQQALPTRLQELVNLANEAFAASAINAEFAIAHSQLVNYSETASNNTALSDLEAGSGASVGLPDVGALRDARAADFVILIRQGDPAQHGNCGIAFLPVDFADYQSGAAADSAFSVVTTGTPGPLHCDDHVLAHELGHNLGNAHDRANATGGGIFSYAHGYAVSGRLSTIMATGFSTTPRVTRWSDPSLICDGEPCGVPIGNAGEADVASSLRQVVPLAAMFRESVDLAVLDVAVSDASVRTDDLFEVDVLLENRGDAATEPRRLRILLSSDATVSRDDLEIAALPLGSIAPGAQATLEHQASISEAGTHWLGACLDAAPSDQDPANDCFGSLRLDVRGQAGDQFSVLQLLLLED